MFWNTHNILNVWRKSCESSLNTFNIPRFAHTVSLKELHNRAVQAWYQFVEQPDSLIHHGFSLEFPIVF